MIRWVWLLVLVVVARSAAADAPHDETSAALARGYFLAGQAAYRASDFASAAVAFEQASRALPDPATTFSLAQAYRQLFVVGHDPAYAARAAELYGQYLHDLPHGARSDDARELAANLSTLVELAKYRAGSAVVAKSVVPHTQLMVWSRVSGARAAIDGGTPAPTPVAIDAKPGKHEVTITADHYDDARLEVIAVEGRLVAVEGSLQAKPGALDLHAPADARILVDDVDVVDRGHGVVVPAGHHRVWIGARGRVPAQTEIDLAPGGRATFAPSLETSLRRQRAVTTLVAAGGLAVAALGAFAYAGWEAHHADTLLSIRDRQSWTTSQADDYSGSRASALRWEDISLGIGAGALVVGAIGLYLYRADVPEAPRRTVLTPALGPDSAGMALSGTF